MTGTELATQSAELLAETRLKQPGAAQATPQMRAIEEHPSWEVFARLGVSLRAAIPLHRFRVRDLLALQEGQVFGSLSPDTDDVALLCGQLQLGWGELEVLEQSMAVRLTRLS